MNHIHKQSKASLVWAMAIITLILTIMNFGKLISYFETCYDLPELATVFTFVQVVCEVRNYKHHDTCHSLTRVEFQNVVGLSKGDYYRRFLI